MTRKHRNRIEICASILNIAASESPGVTKLMNTTYLSYSHLSSYLKILTEHRLLEYDNQDKSFKVSMKGRKFLELYAKIAELDKPT
jgi:predicted transcriptional regulator